MVLVYFDLFIDSSYVSTNTYWHKHSVHFMITLFVHCIFLLVKYRFCLVTLRTPCIMRGEMSNRGLFSPFQMNLQTEACLVQDATCVYPHNGPSCTIMKVAP